MIETFRRPSLAEKKYIYVLKAMENGNLPLTSTLLLRYAFHRCCGSSGLAKYAY